MKYITVLDTGYKDYHYEEKLLGKLGYELVVNGEDKFDHEHKIELTRKSVGIFIRWTEIDKEFLEACPNLKFIVRYGTGYDNISLEECRKRDVKVCNVTGYAKNAVSDHALALMFACTRDLFNGRNTFSSTYCEPPDYALFDIHASTLGILGLGKIGGTLAAKSVNLFKKVVAYDPYIDDSRFTSLGVEKVTFEQLLKESDVLSIHCNLTDITRRMINARALQAMKPGSVLINTARGPVVDNAELLRAIEEKKLWRAGLDVFDSENPAEIDKTLLNHPRIISTGHYAWYSTGSHRELQEMAARNMADLLVGKEPEDCLTCRM